jgi:hypothetical protein
MAADEDDFRAWVVMSLVSLAADGEAEERSETETDSAEPARPG